MITVTRTHDLSMSILFPSAVCTVVAIPQENNWNWYFYENMLLGTYNNTVSSTYLFI
jgi:hypothetical protein